ncbi:PREDICTED: signal peptide, CUB and EGF-like domain-containing protein 1 [Priapulus caudatus]|uniref:Signal peptide, CUB and EGF-like domain-containing protein 1 n=1 Tax=Priapulus caudatus TaxID=37621 RepID=A0ABM1F510_PRICU|nr:PREDICTED: signal peptide, CUB and EGF-like domain-containing protein 1 [Priapulus caudatus]
MTTATVGSENASQCYMECQAGEFYDSTADACTKCPMGLYQDEPNKIYCKSCPAGTFTSQLGATSADDCKSCAPGETVTISYTCEQCEVGKYSTDGTACIKCPSGTTTVDVGSTELANCSVGEYIQQ